MTTLISTKLPPAARHLALEWDLLICIAKLEVREQTTTYNYWSFLKLTFSQARARLALIERAGLAVSHVVKAGRTTLGKRWALTEQGRAALDIYLQRIPAPAQTPSVAADSPSPTNPRAADLYATMSERGRDALRKSLPDAVHGRVVDLLKHGTVPPADQLLDWGVRESVATDIETSARNLAERALNTRSSGDEASAATQVPAATDEDVQRARQAGVPVPCVREGEGENAAGITTAAQLLVREAATRRPDLLHRGVLLARLPQLLWAMLQGTVADYGAPLKRARALLKWLAEGAFEVPKGYTPAAGAALLSRIRIASPPPAAIAQLF